MLKEKSMSDVSIENRNKVILWSIFGPLLLSATFCLVEIFYRGLELDDILSVIISYLIPTLLSSAVFALLQQFFLYKDAGNDEKKAILLAASSFVVGLLYTPFISRKETST